MAKGNQQLQSDILRFLEMFPDVKAGGNIQIGTVLAFPLCPKEDSKNLTKRDFDPNNYCQLLEKLGHPKMEDVDKTPDPSTLSIYGQVTSRYIGMHSTVPSKCASESFCQSFSMLGLAERNMESVFNSQVQNVQNEESAAIKSLKNVCANDSLMKDIRLMLEQSSYRPKFQSKHPELAAYIADQDLKVDKATSEHVFTSKNKLHPVFGDAVKKVIDAVDDVVCHQGSEKILEQLKKSKLTCISEQGVELEMKELVEGHVDKCSDCHFVQEMKTRYPTGERLIKIDESDIASVLEFSDRKHQGLRVAYNRIKTWCDFPRLEEEV